MKYVIFDIDGTLANTKAIDDYCFVNAFLSTFQVEYRDVEWESIPNATDWGITETFVNMDFDRNPTEEEYQLMKNNLIKLLNDAKSKDPSHFDEVPGAKAFFDLVSQSEEYVVGVATGAWEESAVLKLNSIGIDVNNIPFSNSSRYKTREDITLDTIQQMNDKTGTKPEKVIYFGDGEWDFKTCRNLNIPLIGIDVNNNGKLTKLGLDNVFQDYLNPKEIIKIIESL